jgi:RNA polymerase sigma-70 factor (ECF subfamily)
MPGDSLVLLIVALAMARREKTPGADRERDYQEVAKVARGDQAALGRLYDRYHRLVYSLAVRVVEDGAAAEEIAQDVFLKLWRSAPAFDAARGDLVSWLVTVTRNRAIDQLRSRQQRDARAWVALPEAPDQAWFLASPPVQVNLDAVDRMAKALQQLPEKHRRLLELAYYEGYTQSEIAAKLEMPIGTVKTWTRSALETLRQALEPSS